MTNTLTPDDLGRIATKAWIEFMLETSIVKDRSTLGDYDNGDEGFKTLMRSIGLAVADATTRPYYEENIILLERLRHHEQAYRTIAQATGLFETAPEQVRDHILSMHNKLDALAADLLRSQSEKRAAQEERDELRDELRLSQQAYLTVANAAGVPEFGPEALAALIGATQMVYSQTDRQYKLAAQQRDKLREAMDALRAEAEEHRARYDAKRSDTFHMPDQQYWGGRRDEAGHFRDKLTKILEVPK